MSYQDRVTALALTYLDLHKLHVEDDGQIRCKCGEWFQSMNDASIHFFKTTEAHVDENVGFRAWWRRWTGRISGN